MSEARAIEAPVGRVGGRSWGEGRGGVFDRLNNCRYSSYSVIFISLVV